MSVFTCFERPISIQRVLLNSLLLITLGLTLAQSVAANEACTLAETIPINSTIQKVRPASDGTDLLRYDFPSPGMVALHASSTEGTPIIAFRGDGCFLGDNFETGQGYSIIRQTPIDMVLRIHTAGAHYLTVSAEDADVGLASYKLVTAFAPDPVVPDEVVILAGDGPESCKADLPTMSSQPFNGDHYVELFRDAEWTKDVDPIECELISGGSAAPGVLLFETPEEMLTLLASAKTLASSAVEATLFDGTGCAPGDRLVEGSLSAGSFMATTIHGGDVVLDLRAPRNVPYSVGVKYFDLCGRLDGGDDHADVPLCSTLLAVQSITDGWIGGGVARDEDFFTFKVPSPETVTIDVRGEGRLKVALYDGMGQRLEARETGVIGGLSPFDGSTRIVRSLGDDRYFLRVSSEDGLPGAYSVRLGQAGSP